MKRIMIILAVALLLLSGCEKEKDPYDISPEAKSDIESIRSYIYQIRDRAERALDNGTEGEERTGSLELALEDIIYYCNQTDDYTIKYLIR